jgi:hypothetical protein|eukprot:7391619-Prymnesium_polylepis.2
MVVREQRQNRILSLSDTIYAIPVNFKVERKTYTKKSGDQECKYIVVWSMDGFRTHTHTHVTDCASNQTVVDFVRMHHHKVMDVVRNVALLKSVEAQNNPRKIAKALKFLMSHGLSLLALAYIKGQFDAKGLQTKTKLDAVKLVKAGDAVMLV